MRKPCRATPAQRKPIERGLTLIELIVVIAIVSTLLGLSAALFQRVGKDNALPTAVSSVSSVLRAARNFSVRSGIPSRVYVQRGSGAHSITAFAFDLVAAWQFDDHPLESATAEVPLEIGTELRGAFNTRAVTTGDCALVRGKIGTGVWFRNDGAALLAEDLPRYVSPVGFSLEAWIHFEGPDLDERDRADRYRKRNWVDPRRSVDYAVISKDGSYELGVLGDGAVYVEIGSPVSNDGSRRQTVGGLVPLERWTHISATYDGLQVTIEVDGIEAEAVPEGFEKTAPNDWPTLPDVPPSDGYLSISHPNRMFLGVIDQPKIRIALEPRHYELPPGVFFLGSATSGDEEWIRFDSRGSLSPVFHSRPVVLRLTDSLPDPDAERKRSYRTEVRPSLDLDEPEGDEDSALEEEIADPRAALAKYLKEYSEAERGDETDDTSDAADQQHDEGRVRTIIIDMTGTIRG